MGLGYDGKLYILAFDHRGSFQKKMFGIEGDPSPEQTETIADAKHLIFEGMQKAVEQGAEAGATGVLVDEQFGGDIPAQAHGGGLKLAMPGTTATFPSSRKTSPSTWVGTSTIRSSGRTSHRTAATSPPASSLPRSMTTSVRSTSSSVTSRPLRSACRAPAGQCSRGMPSASS